MPRELRVLFLPPGEPPRDEVITDGLKGMQRLVGGMIETIHLQELGPGIMLVGNDEARLLEMPWNVLTDTQPLAGPLFACGFTEGGDSRSLTGPERDKVLAFFTGRRLRGKSFMPPGPAFTMDPEEAERTAYLDAAMLAVQQHLGLEDVSRLGEIPGFEHGRDKALIDRVVSFIRSHRAMPDFADLLGIYVSLASK
jgi:hypothetical protein